MSNVYLIQEPREDRDLSSAQRYGTITSVFSLNDRPSMTPGPCLQKARRVLAHFHPDDYLVWAGGDFVAGILIGIALKEQNFQSVKMLRWDRERDTSGGRTGGGYYIPFEIQMKG